MFQRGNAMMENPNLKSQFCWTIKVVIVVRVRSESGRSLSISSVKYGIDRDQRALDRFRCDYPVELVHGCAHEFLASFAFRGTELVYSDPPYLHATRRSNRRYRYEYTDVSLPSPASVDASHHDRSRSIAKNRTYVLIRGVLQCVSA